MVVGPSCRRSSTVDGLDGVADDADSDDKTGYAAIMVALGIDLGTTYSLVAVAQKGVDGGRARVLRDEHGEGRVPSAVFYGATQAEGAIVGFAALAAARQTSGSLLTGRRPN